MAEDVKRTHTFGAEAHSFGGSLILPVNQDFPSQASVSLGPGGGISHDTKGAFHHHKVVSANSTYAHVLGSAGGNSGPWTTVATSVIENLNIQEIVTADRVVARISMEHPKEGYTPKVTLVGSNFINLRIAGYPVTAVLNFNLLTPADEYPKTNWLENAGFLDAARKQVRQRPKKSPLAKEVEARYGWVDTQEGIDLRGFVTCSLVDSIDGTFPGKDGAFPGISCGNVVKIPEVGKFYFGELTVDRNSFRLTMIRAELGSPVGGSLIMADAVGGGPTGP